MNNKVWILGAFLGGLSVVLGAFGAHGLKNSISLESLQVFETGVRYQIYHALLLLILGGTSFITEKRKKVMFYLIVIGLIFFSGSIYGLATNTLTAFDFKEIGFITPIGGLFLIISWLILLIIFLKNKGN